MTRYAVVVGINKYEDSKSLRSLRYAVADAKRVVRFFNDCRFDVVESRYESEATFASLQKLLLNMQDALRPNDTFLFYFAGHGIEKGDGDDRRQYFMAHDTIWRSLKYCGGQAMTLGFVEGCTKIDGVSRAIVLDSCRCKLTAGDRGADQDALPRYSSRDIDRNVGSAGHSPLRVLCSCQPDGRAFEADDLEGGIFTSAMLSVFEEYRTQGRPIGFNADSEQDIWKRMIALYQIHAIPEEDRQEPYARGPASGVILVPGQETVGHGSSHGARPTADEVVESSPQSKPDSCSEDVLEATRQALRKRLSELQRDLEPHRPALSEELERSLQDELAENPADCLAVLQEKAPNLPMAEVLEYVCRLRKIQGTQRVLAAMENSPRKETNRSDKEPTEQENLAGLELVDEFFHTRHDFARFPFSDWISFLNQKDYPFDRQDLLARAVEHHDELCWRQACRQNTNEAYHRYLDSVPNGRRVADARRALFLMAPKDMRLRQQYLDVMTPTCARMDKDQAKFWLACYGAAAGAIVSLSLVLFLAIPVHWRLAAFGRGAPVLYWLIAAGLGILFGLLVGSRRAGYQEPDERILASLGADLGLYTGAWVGGLAAPMAVVFWQAAEGVELDPGGLLGVGVFAIIGAALGIYAGSLLGRIIGGLVWPMVVMWGAGTDWIRLAGDSQKALKARTQAPKT